MSSEKAFLHLYKLRRNDPVTSCAVIRLCPDTSTLVFPFNFSDLHWCVAKATCHEGKRFLTVFNSIPGQDAELIEACLPAVLDCFLNNSSILSWSNSQWASQKLRYGQFLQQSDSFNCGVHTIFSTLALVKQQEPSLPSMGAKALRFEYA